jgi:hypothetical protein
VTKNSVGYKYSKSKEGFLYPLQLALCDPPPNFTQSPINWYLVSGASRFSLSRLRFTLIFQFDGHLPAVARDPLKVKVNLNHMTISLGLIEPTKENVVAAGEPGRRMLTGLAICRTHSLAIISYTGRFKRSTYPN